MEAKTEQPTPKKRQDARKEGQIARSSEIVDGAQLIVSALWFRLEGPKLMADVQNIFKHATASISLPFDQILTQTALLCIQLLIRFIGSLAIALVLVSMLASFVQTGVVFIPKKLMPQLSALSPASNAKNLFSMKKLYSLLLILFKVVLLSLVFFYILSRYGRSLVFLPNCGVQCAIPVLAKLCGWLLGSLIAFYTVLGAIDYLFEHRQLMKQLMMSKEEIKQEFKNIERNPAIKQRMRAMHEEVQRSDMPSRVARSSVLVRNPAHIAVCLYYKQDETPLPIVTEKGAGHHALRMIGIAQQYQVPIVANIPLAQQLMRDAKVDETIPEPLFEPVAEVLNLIMLDEEEEEADVEEEAAKDASA
ncbi:putative Type III secretion system apparatus protein SsaU [Candidatus Glomeribacter gigasporarum BEG34]|uniref:Putative Type III secretion system apparatus protein SsaU n=1 Tax=Candidatus Glomeribacter gigasporarum BEG34 TaxID=1070319 RepID=G2J9I7_9BURK|nr:EscU/YscU/HrcU family type III secretion system export apparatus switch protein [Candidatus Glomeribacter gigasporarum]CCD29434.1 putative Type III secretion system apparatus protein SsaU [Candidatus Glomeribacter gigasporarum BEG34]